MKGSTDLPSRSDTLARIAKYHEFGALIGFGAVFVFFSIFATNFLTLENIAGILAIVAELGLMVVGVSFLMISGEFDLSVGSVFGFTAVVLGMLINAGVPVPVAILITLLVGGSIGLLNGLITVKTGIPSFITTLGMLMWWRGMILAFSGGQSVIFWGSSTLLTTLNKPFLGSFRTSAFWFLGLLVIFQIILSRTKYGNAVYAVGGNELVAREMGVNSARVKIINFVLVGLLTAFAGCIAFARFKIVDPLMGTGMELQAISAAVIGGVLLTGGFGSILGAFIGTLLVGMVSSGLILLGAPSFYYQAFIGIVLIVAAVINVRTRRLVTG